MTQSTAIQRANPSQIISGSFTSADRANAVLQEAASRFHLVSPAPSVGQLPEGCSVSLSSVLVSIEHETYPTAGGDDDGGGGGKRGLSKSALDRIAGAAGVSWDPHLSRRLDDGSDAHYCMFVVVGTVRSFDGAPVTIQGTKEMDMREGSAQVEALRARHKAKLARWEAGGRKGYAPRPPDGQIREMRLHLVGHSESKARLRAIRSIGVRSSYSAAELAKPFVVARLMFTGQTDDPELRRAFALKRADAMLASSTALYGPPAARRDPTMALAPAMRPPPLGMGVPDDEDDVPEPAPVVHRDVKPENMPPAEAAPAPTDAPAEGASARFTIPGGPERGTPLPKASDRTLGYWQTRLAAALEKGEGRPGDEELLAALREEIFGRESAGGDAR